MPIMIMLDAYHKSGSIFIEVGDDGRGLDREALLRKGLENGLLKPGEDYSDEQIYELIFHPGLSTAKQISDVSGRGVGMDVVRRNIQDVGGNIQIASERGHGTKITICLPLTLAILCLPLTLAILDGQLVTVGRDCYIIPLLSIIESVQARNEMINRVAGKNELFRFRGEHLPILRLYELFGPALVRTVWRARRRHRSGEGLAGGSRSGWPAGRIVCRRFAGSTAGLD